MLRKCKNEHECLSYEEMLLFVRKGTNNNHIGKRKSKEK